MLIVSEASEAFQRDQLSAQGDRDGRSGEGARSNSVAKDVECPGKNLVLLSESRNRFSGGSFGGLIQKICTRKGGYSRVASGA